jgi:DNA-binding CsgD family transcriptional regulator
MDKVAFARDPDLLDVLAGGDPPAFATDSRERLVFWNRGAAELLGRTSDEVLGRHCWEVIGGRDVFGNRFCYGNCAVAASLRAGEPVRGFELTLPARGEGKVLTHVTILRIPSVRPDLFTIVHILDPVQESSRLARVLERLGATPVAPGAAPPPAPEEADTASPPLLTTREREVLRWVAAGLQNKEIAQTLDLSLATVRNHIHNILEKLGVHSKLEAVSLAFRNGWVSRNGAGPDAPPAPARGCMR